MIYKIFSGVYLLIVAILAVYVFLVACILWPIAAIIEPKRKKMIHIHTSFWASFLSYINPLWKIKVYGMENIDRSKTYIIVANHQSLIDPLIISRTFIHYKWVSKIENYKIPIIGLLLRVSEYIPVARGKTKSTQRMMEKCREAIKHRNSLFIFPEGSRTKTGKLGTFKEGAFQLAIETKTPILPIVLDGAYQSIPKGKMSVKGRNKIHMNILKEISPSEFEGTSPAELANKVFIIIEEELNRMRALEKIRS